MPLMRCLRSLGLAVTLAAVMAAVVVAQEEAEAPAVEAEESLSPAREALRGMLTPETVAQKLGTVVLILLLSYLAYRAVIGGLGQAIRAAEVRALALPGAARQRGQRAVTIMSLLSNIVRWVISLLALIWVLGALGINLLPVLTGVGFLGAAIAFGAQALVRDVVSGFFLLLEGQYAVGDYVELAGKFGRVESVGLRTTVLRDLDNQVHHIPNGGIAACTVYLEHFVNYLLITPLASAGDAERAAQLIHGAACEAKRQLPRHLLMVGPPATHATGEGPAVVSLPVAVFPTQDWVATTELPNRVKFILAGSEIPLPDGMAPQAIADLTQMPLAPAEPEEGAADTTEPEVIARWREWVGGGGRQQGSGDEPE